MILRKTDFRNRTKAPANYIPGLARGDTGFETGIDTAPTDSRATAKLKSIVEKQRKLLANPNSKEKQEFLVDEAQFDKNDGFKSSLFKSEEYSKDDQEADDIYSKVERRVAEKGMKKIKGANSQAIIEETVAPLQNIQKLFTQEKQDLGKLDVSDWMNIPDAVIHKSKDRNRNKYTPVNDSLLTMGLKKGNVSTIDAQNHSIDPNLTESQKEGYLTQLVQEESIHQIQDVQKARLLFQSARESDPQNVKPWLASAKLEEINGKLQEARNLLEEGISKNMFSSELWLEYIRLAPQANKTQLYNRALQSLKDSVEIWKDYVAKQTNQSDKIVVLKRALTNCPEEETMWTELVNAHSVGHPELPAILAQAVENCPLSVDLWLKWADQSELNKARLILNKANKVFKNSSSKIWIAAAAIEELNNSQQDKIDKIVNKGLQKVNEIALNKIGIIEILEICKNCEEKKHFLTGKAVLRFYCENQLLKNSDGLFFEEKVVIMFQEMQKMGISKLAMDLLVLAEDIKEIKVLENQSTQIVELIFENIEKLSEMYQKVDYLAKMTFKYCRKPKLVSAFLAHLLTTNCQIKESMNAVLDLNKQIQDYEIPDLGKSQIAETCLEFLMYLEVDQETILEFAEKHINFANMGRIHFELRVRAKRETNLDSVVQSLAFILKKTDLESEKLKIGKLISDIQLYQNKFTENEHFWRQFVKSNPNDSKATCELAFSILRTKTIHQARMAYSDLINTNKTTEDNWLVILDIEREYPQVQRNLVQKAAKLYSENALIRVKELELNIESQKTKCPELLKLFPASVELSILLARVFYKENKLEKCKGWLFRGKMLDQNNVDVLGFLAIALPENIDQFYKEFEKIKDKKGRIFETFYRHVYLSLPVIGFKEELWNGFLAFLRENHGLKKK